LCQGVSRDLGIAIGDESYRAERDSEERKNHLRP
jgi:hypothetical protein